VELNVSLIKIMA